MDYVIGLHGKVSIYLKAHALLPLVARKESMAPITYLEKSPKNSVYSILPI